MSGRRRGCPLCGTPDAACGTPSHNTPVDELWQEVAVVGGELNEYEVEVGGNKTTMQLNERDAKRLGVLPGGEDEAAEDESLVTSTKTRTTSNKARTTENK
jgi:hypothetical protein